MISVKIISYPLLGYILNVYIEGLPWKIISDFTGPIAQLVRRPDRNRREIGLRLCVGVELYYERLCLYFKKSETK